MAKAIEMLNIRKQFPKVLACDNVTLSIDQGEIHGLIGENGAGKSTIMNILYGLHQPDDGIIKINGEEQIIRSPIDAIKLGIGMIHQHFMLMPNQTVLRNIILGDPKNHSILIDEKKAKKDISELMEKFGIKVDLDKKISHISIGEKQRVEILKALYRDVRVLILDEPTAVLTPSETDALLKTMVKLKEEGCTIVFITHKLKEVLAVTDNVTVMRKGVVTGKGPTSEMNVDKLSKLIVGRDVNFTVPLDEFKPGETVLKVEHISTKSRSGRMPIKDINFEIRKGEIVGIAGVEGNGQSDLIDAIAGITRTEKGTITLCGKDITKLSIKERRNSGLSHVPEDRLKTGSSKECSIADNLILVKYDQAPFSNKLGIMDGKKISAFSEELCQRFLVKTPSAEFKLGTLSGGNMQKVVIAREFDCNPELMIAAQPTRGVDIGATEYIHAQIAGIRNEGKGVLLVSAELDEVMALSDRILVMYEGEVVAEFDRGEADEYEIGEYMLGARRRETDNAG